MTDDEILAAAAARANMENENPTDEDFVRAEEEVRAELDDAGLLEEVGQMIGSALVDAGDIAVDGPLEFELHMVVNEPGTLANGIEDFAANLGRYGIDGFYLIAREATSDRAWIIKGDQMLGNDEEDDEEGEENEGEDS